jgi:hypothetical protein
MVFKLVAIIGGVLLMAGVALAGTLTSLDSTNSPSVATTPPPAISTVQRDDRGQENELRGRANEPGEDVSGPCDEPEHAADPRCGGTAPAPGADDDRASNSGSSSEHSGGHDDSTGRGDDSSHSGGHDDSSGRGEDSGHSGRGDDSGHGGGDDD